MVKNRWGQFDHGILRNLKNEYMEWTDFLHVGANLGKLKVI